MKLNQFKSRYKRIVKYKEGIRYIYNYKKKKMVCDTQDNPFIGYMCECGCGIFGNFDLYSVNNVPMSLDCGLKHEALNSPTLGEK